MCFAYDALGGTCFFSFEIKCDSGGVGLKQISLIMVVMVV